MSLKSTSDDNFINDPVDTISMEDEIELTDILKALIETFNEDLNQVKNTQIRLSCINNKNEEESGIVTINDFNRTRVSQRGRRRSIL